MWKIVWKMSVNKKEAKRIKDWFIELPSPATSTSSLDTIKTIYTEKKKLEDVEEPWWFDIIPSFNACLISLTIFIILMTMLLLFNLIWTTLFLCSCVILGTTFKCICSHICDPHDVPGDLKDNYPFQSSAVEMCSIQI